MQADNDLVCFLAQLGLPGQVTLAGFRKAQFQVLVATDVAARGLDISGVELVLQTSVPKDHETYIHRSACTSCCLLVSTTWLLHPFSRRSESMACALHSSAVI